MRWPWRRVRAKRAPGPTPTGIDWSAEILKRTSVAPATVERFVASLPSGKATMSGYFGVDAPPPVKNDSEVTLIGMWGSPDGVYLARKVNARQQGGEWRVSCDLEWLRPVE